MKKLSLILTLLGACLMGFAQVDFHLQAGMTLSTFDRNLMDEFGFVNYRQDLLDGGISASSGPKNSLRLGAMVGFEMDVYISDDDFLKTGFRYTNGGDAYFFKTPDIQYASYWGLITTDARFKFRPRLDYLAIPINYGRRFGDFSVYGGITPHINIASALRVNSFELRGSSAEEDWDREDDFVEATKTVYFLNAGVNYRIPAWDFDQIVALNISYGLNAAYDDPAVAARISEARLWLIEVSFGFTISTAD